MATLIQNMLHPVGRNDGQALAVGDVIIGAQGMLNAVAGPAGRTAAKGVDPVAAIGAGQHHLSACIVILRVFQALPGIDHTMVGSSLQ